MKSFTKILVVVLTLSLLLGACAPASAPVEEAPVEEEVVEEAVVEEAVVEEEPAVSDMCMGAKAGDTLTVMSQWSGAEEEKLNAIFKPLVDECGIEIVAESTRDNAVLDARVKSTPPDILFWPDALPLNLYLDQLVPLDTLGGVAENYDKSWINKGSEVYDQWVTVDVKADPKSLVWYSPAQFEIYGYSVPTSFAELDALVEQMVADGLVPWSMGMESEAATGWTGSDYIQDLVLTFEGPDYVNDLISGKVAYDDAGVVAAYEQWAKWASDPVYTVGGATGTVETGFLDAIYKVFQPEPEAMMVKQSGFAGGEVKTKYPDLEYGVDYDFFGFPGAKGLQGGSDSLYAFGTSAATKAMVTYLTTQAGADAWAAAGFDISPNKLSAGKYADVSLSKKSDMILSATGFTPDMGDAIGAPFNTSEWAALIEVVQGGDVATALAKAAAAQAEALAD